MVRGVCRKLIPATSPGFSFCFSLVIWAYFTLFQTLKKKQKKTFGVQNARRLSPRGAEQLAASSLIMKGLIAGSCIDLLKVLQGFTSHLRIGTFIAMSGMCSSGASVEATVSRDRQNSSHSLGSVNADTVSSLWSLKTLISLIDWLKSRVLMC